MNLLLVFALLFASSPLFAADDVLREESESEQALSEAKRREDQLVEALYDAHDRVRQLQQEDLRAPSPTDGKIVNGVPTSNFPTVGALLRGASPDKLSAWCTGTLVGCTTFVTAGHCVRSAKNDRKPIGAEEYGQLRVFLQHAGMFEVAGVESHRDYAPPYADVAVITLKQPVDRIVPTRLNTAVDVRNGASGTIAGFGRTGGTRADYGIKNFGAIRTATCQLRAQSDAVVCWRFNTVGAAPGTHSNTCNGDSGGPLFVDSADSVPKPLLAGITSTGDRRDCLYGDESYDVDVKTFASWIVEHAKEPLDGKACGLSPSWGAPGVATEMHTGALNGGVKESKFVVEVPPATRLLRLAFNGQDDGRGGLDFDVHVRKGVQSTVAASECALEGTVQFGFCEIKNPVAGKWSVTVTRKRGDGAYQLTSTTYEN